MLPPSPSPAEEECVERSISARFAELDASDASTETDDDDGEEATEDSMSSPAPLPRRWRR